MTALDRSSKCSTRESVGYAGYPDQYLGILGLIAESTYEHVSSFPDPRRSPAGTKLWGQPALGTFVIVLTRMKEREIKSKPST